MLMRFLDNRLRRYPQWRKWRGLPEPISISQAQITREALRALASIKLPVDAEYPVQFAQQSGRVRIRLPVQYAQKK